MSSVEGEEEKGLGTRLPNAHGLSYNIAVHFLHPKDKVPFYTLIRIAWDQHLFRLAKVLAKVLVK